MTTTPAITVTNLTKSFKENHVLKGVTFTVEKGSIFALLGSNGAGKTTIVKILSTLTRPDGGHAVVCGYDVVRQPGQVRRHISLTGQFAAVDEILTGRENLWIMGELRRLPDKNEQAARLLELFRLTDAADQQVSSYSGGMRRRLDIAMSMMGQSPIVFLDEPTTGLDPQNRLAMWEIVKSMAASGTTVFLTTQYLDEAEHLAHHIAVLHAGAIIADGTADALKRKLPQGIMRLQFESDAVLKQAAQLLGAYVAHQGKGAHALDIQTDGGAMNVGDHSMANFIVPGIIMLTIGQSAPPISVRLNNDMTKGVIDRFRTMPIAKSSVLLGHVAATVLQSVAMVVSTICVSLLVGFRPQADLRSWLAAAGIIGLYIIMMMWLAALIGLYADNAEEASGLMTLIGVLPFLSSGFVPTETLPRVLRVFAENQPMTPIIDTVRSLLLAQPLADGICNKAVLWCVGLAVVFYILSFYLYGRKTASEI